MTHRIELLWFSDCPNHPVARQMLADAIERIAPGTWIEEVDASDPEVAMAQRFPGSPTIRIDGVDIEPGFADPGDYTPRCRLYRTSAGLRGVPDPALDREGAGSMTTASGTRPTLLARALRLEYLTVGWNIVEGVIAIAAAMASGSVALLGFGIDSFVESASGSVMIWRLHAERRTTDEERIEHVERRARKLVAGSLVLLAVYIAWDSITSLVANERPEPSVVGILLAVASLSVMWWLARQKRQVGTALGSRAMTADAFQTDACFWLSLFLLVGIGANALFGFWWADPLAALGMTFFIGREAVEAWRGEDED